MPDTGPSTTRFTRLLLVGLLAVLLVRLAGFVHVFAGRSVQMDLAAFYVAGQSVAAGLSPYVNHVERDPPIWDGVDRFRHSRFLYPPLAARGFAVLALVPYAAAKWLWMLSSLAALGLAVGLGARLTGLAASTDRALALAVLAAAYYPLLALLERGQIDAFTLLLVLAALVLMRGERRPGLAGALLALATLLKLNCVLVVPFLVLRRRWRVLAGYFGGGLLLLAASLALDGPRALVGYARRELPRISAHGEGGTAAMTLPADAFRAALHGATPEHTVLDGREYPPSYFRFVLNGSLVPTLRGALARVGVSLRPWPVALGLLAASVALAAAWQRRCRRPFGREWETGEFTYWQSVLVLILLCEPVTWAMNTVWLLPVGAILLHEMPRRHDRWGTVSLLLAAAGLGLAAAPDPYGSFMLSPFGVRSMDGKYVLAELACLAGLLGLWRR